MTTDGLHRLVANEREERIAPVTTDANRSRWRAMLDGHLLLRAVGRRPADVCGPAAGPGRSAD